MFQVDIYAFQVPIEPEVDLHGTIYIELSLGPNTAMCRTNYTLSESLCRIVQNNKTRHVQTSFSKAIPKQYKVGDIINFNANFDPIFAGSLKNAGIEGGCGVGGRHIKCGIDVGAEMMPRDTL